MTTARWCKTGASSTCPAAGRQDFPDVSAQIRPETVTLSGAGLGIVEQNFDFDLLTPAALMQKAVGETVTLVRINPATGAETRERARILAANGGVVMQIGDRIEVLRDDGLPARVIFDRVPEQLRARPTLVGHARGVARRTPAGHPDLSDPAGSAGRPIMSLCSTRPTAGWTSRAGSR